MSITNSLPSANAHFISLSTAEDMTERYRTNMETILATAYRNQGILPQSETFNRYAFETLLAIDNCAGLRIYYGMDENLKVHAIIVPVNSQNEDILPASSTPNLLDSGILEEGQRCPDLCPPPSPLNE